MTFPKLLLPAACVLCLFGCPAEDGGGGDDGAATGTGSSGSGGESCEPGMIDACLCPDNSPSTRVCLADGSGFSACDCVGMSGSGGGSDGSTGSDGGASATSGNGSSDEGPADSGSGSDSTGPAPECDGSHPLVEGDLRYCEAGNCYCGDFDVMPPFDVCYAMDIADACCPVDVVCY